MNTNNAIRSNLKVILPLGILTAGLALLVSHHYFPNEQSQLAPLSEKTESRDQFVEAQAKSTSQLIKEASEKSIASSQKSTIDYPMVTPQALETPFSPTLEGTDIDGQLKVGEDGKLLVNIEVKDFFDYFLSAVGEVSPELALEELLKIARQSLPPENFEEAKQLLDNYLAYKEEAVTLLAQPMLPRDQQTREYQLQMMEDGLRQLREIRRQHMSEEQVQAFFGLEEAYQEYTLATVKIQFDETMSNEEKAAMMQYHRSLLPDIVRHTEVQLVSDGAKNATMHQALSSGDEATLVSELETSNYSESQKQEIIDYQRNQAEFNERYQAYQAKKKELLSEVSNEALHAEIVNNLQAEYFFTEQELTQAKVRDLRS
jgi:lipase chaperone LimK